MKKHILSGVIIGGLFGVVAAWIAMSSALPAGGVVALAGAIDGIMAGIGIGWLIGVNVAEGAADEAEEEFAQLAQSNTFAPAHR
jgi:membrane associated rhomboid family serine protease